MDATIEVLRNVRQHPNADRLELADVLGYQVVIPRDVYEGGEKVVFVHPDAQLPKDQDWATAYLQYAPKRVKAIRLREEWSEGLVISLDKLPIDFTGAEEGLDVSDQLGILHYEAPQPQDENAIMGSLPFGIPKTDETRFEEKRNRIPFGELCDVTLKIDGKSGSLAYNLRTDEMFVLGRRMTYPLYCENDYGRAFSPELVERFRQYCKDNEVSLCLRGECYGQGIQGSDKNPHSKMNKGFALFSVYNIDRHEYERNWDKFYFIFVAQELDIPTVPILERNVPITEEMLEKYSKELKQIDGKPFEGVVVKYPQGSFKIINKWYDAAK